MGYRVDSVPDDDSGYSPILDGPVDDCDAEPPLDPSRVDLATGEISVDELAQILRGFELLQAPQLRKARNRVDNDPTPEEIHAMCAAIRTLWSPGEMRARAGRNMSRPVKVRSVTVGKE